MATASSEQRVLQMPDVTEMALAISVGYLVVSHVVAMIVLPSLPRFRGTAAVWVVEGVLVVGLAGLAYCVWALMQRARWSWYVFRYGALALAVLRTIGLIVVEIMLIGGSAKGIALLPPGQISAFLVFVLGGESVPEIPGVIWVTLFLVDIVALVAEYVVFFSMGNRGTRQYFGIE